MTAPSDYRDIYEYLVRFWNAMDRADYDELLTRLTDNARWHRDRWRESKACTAGRLNIFSLPK